MPNVGPLEIAGLLLLALLLFGAKRLPEIGRSLGSGMREFKDSIGGKTHPEDSHEEPTELAAVPVAPPSEPAVTVAAPRDHDSTP
jgi:sec-independent protein translocase protein TatA